MNSTTHNHTANQQLQTTTTTTTTISAVTTVPTVTNVNVIQAQADILLPVTIANVGDGVGVGVGSLQGTSTLTGTGTGTVPSCVSGSINTNSTSSSNTPHYLQVCETEEAEPVELPAEEDGSLLLSTVSAQFYGCTGLKYREPATRTTPPCVRGLRLQGERLYAPQGGWGQRRYVCVFPRTPPQLSQTQHALGSSGADTPGRPPPPRHLAARCSDLIVLGLPWKTDEEAIREYFSSFGDLLLVQIKRDPKTGSSKGFGFIKFCEYEAQTKALAQRHLIDGRWCDVRVPNSKEGSAPKVPSKVFVGRCTENISSDDLRDYFSQFGQVSDVFIPKPFRAFGFVTFLDPEVAQGLCGEDHIVKGVSVNVSNASPKQDQCRFRHPGPPKGDGSAPRHPRSCRNGSLGSGYQWPGRRLEMIDVRGRPPGVNGGGAQSANVGLPMNIPVNQALVAAALNRAGWGIVNNVPVDGYQGGPTQPGPVSHQRGGYLNWVPQNGNGGDGQPGQWAHQPDVSVKNYVKYE